MRPITFTLERLTAMPRPAGYLDELRACALSIEGDQWTFDRDSEAYKALKEKYRTTCGNCGGQHQTADCPIPPNYDGNYRRDSKGSSGCGCAE
jgi:hypothetical protein